MRIETVLAEMAVHVSASGDVVELRVGEPTDGASRAARLSLPQAEMVSHALGLVVAQIREAQRRSAEEREHLAQVIADTEVRRR